MSTDAKKLSPVETIKEESNFLRGTLAEEIAEATDHFDKNNIQLLKFHGTYQQDDRDHRAQTKQSGDGKAYQMMIRLRIPGGRITSQQMLSMLDLCEQMGNSTMKITTRQTIQLHGVLKRDLKPAIKRINELALSTLAACGDVNRNIMCCPAKRNDPVHQEMERLTDELTAAMAPQTPAYHQLWVTDEETGERTLASEEVVEPLYGPTYLPRKFKMGIGLPHDNCIDIYTQDIGLLAVVREGKIIGYNVLAGGGFGRTPSAAKTFPALGKRMAFARPDQVVGVCQAILKVQRDYGNRTDRKVARMKYLIHDWGIERFRAEVERYFGERLEDCTADDVHDFDDHMGWQPQGDGRWSYGWNIENGRLYDSESIQLKGAMRAVCREFQTEIRMTSHQSVIFTDIAEADQEKLVSLLKQHGVRTTEETSTVRRWSMSCVALPTCGLAITESERRLPSIIDALEQPLAKLGLDRERFTIRMTGCPNGCARPYNADLALVGKAKDKYTLFAGGGWLGNRLGYIYKDLVSDDTVVDELIGIFAAYKAHRKDEESLGDFCTRVGGEDLAVMAAAAPRP